MSDDSPATGSAACPSSCEHASEYECCLAVVRGLRIPSDRMQGACDISYNLALRHAAEDIERLSDGR